MLIVILNVTAMQNAKKASGKEVAYEINSMEEEVKEDTKGSKIMNEQAHSKKMKLKKGITVDSGSHHNVMPKRMMRGAKIRPSEGSARGMHYVAANKGTIANEGEEIGRAHV